MDKSKKNNIGEKISTGRGVFTEFDSKMFKKMTEFDASKIATGNPFGRKIIKE